MFDNTIGVPSVLIAVEGPVRITVRSEVNRMTFSVVVTAVAAFVLGGRTIPWAIGGASGDFGVHISVNEVFQGIVRCGRQLGNSVNYCRSGTKYCCIR